MRIRFYAVVGALTATVLGLAGLTGTGPATAATAAAALPASIASAASTAVPAVAPAAAAQSSPAASQAAAPEAARPVSAAQQQTLALPAGTEQECPPSGGLLQEQCQIFVRHVRKAAGTASPAVGSPTGGYGAGALQDAYGLLGESSTAGTGVTVAVVDAYNDPHAAADLKEYRAQYGLTPCSSSGAGCVTVLNQNGATSPLPSSTDVGWEDETALDIEMISAICPNCHIDLFEANSATLPDLGTAENSAAKVAKFISNSWNGPDFPGESSYDLEYFDHPGVLMAFASGDDGFGTGYPAASQLVTAVGGTDLTETGDGYTSVAWNGAGAGCSAGEPKPAWQADAECANRTETDVSAVAYGPAGIELYSSSGDCDVSGDWCAVYGTSVATPIITALAALAGTPTPRTFPVSYLYTNQAALTKVTSGSDGTCEASRRYLCNAEYSLSDGYNGPTGLGTPTEGPAAFEAPTGADPVVSVINPGSYDLQAGRQYSLPAIIAYDSEPGETLTYSAAGLPKGLSMKTATGAISGTVAAAANATVRVTVHDKTGASATVGFRIAVVKSMTAAYRAGTGQVHLDLGGMCLDDAGNSAANGTAVRVQKCATTAAETWLYLPSGTPGGAGTLRIHGKCLDAKGSSNGSKIILYTCDSGAGEAWEITGAEGELYNPQSGRCLNDPDGAKNGTQLVAWTCNDTDSQAWTLPASPVTSGVAGKCVTDAGDSASNGAAIVSSACNGSAGQRFTVDLDGTVRIHGKCLYVQGQGTTDGSPVSLNSCDGAATEYWAVTAFGMIENLNSGKCLADPDNSASNGRRLEIEDCYNEPGEVWAVS